MPWQPESQSYYAHTSHEKDWEPLDIHLKEVSRLASVFASAWSAAEWGRLLGLWHDLGKYSAEFQTYLRATCDPEAHLEQKPGKKVDHSTAGAKHARNVFAGSAPVLGDLIAYAIAGHHAGLPDAFDETGSSGLFDRVVKLNLPSVGRPPIEVTLDGNAPPLKLPSKFKPKRDPAYQLAFFTRMLFSALVDADFLATESYMASERADARGEAPRADWAAWDRRLSEHLDGLDSASAERADGPDVSPLATALLDGRREVLGACREVSTLPPGLFSLTAPTGVGKTLASLAFAVRHAETHGLRRIVYAIPFTSIIEQTADVFRGALGPLGDRFVLEHHVNLDPKNETTWSRLASENWDAPLVVTTNVQLFESLHAAKPSACRKLHRLADSVIVLDEAQSLPVEVLAPCLAALEELARNYGCTVVICTATRPAVEKTDEFPVGLKGVRPIVAGPGELSKRLRRVTLSDLGPVVDAELVERLRTEPQALCVVNTRPHAAALFRVLDGGADAPENFHLSTRLCGRHRAEVLQKVRKRLERGKPCRVVSTQLVEAGVDLDFPAVFRAMAGLDAIVQAAGRCNREGHLPEGRLYLFEPVGVKPPRSVGLAVETLIDIRPEHPDLLSTEAVEAYFRHHYSRHRLQWESPWDKPGVLAADTFTCNIRQAVFKFRCVAAGFRMIEDDGLPVVVPYGDEGQAWVKLVRGTAKLGRDAYRKLQRYTVSIPRWHVRALVERGSVIEAEDGGRPAVLTESGLYDPRLGLLVDGLVDNPRDPADFIL